jgi:hypothetical protein
VESATAGRRPWNPGNHEAWGKKNQHKNGEAFMVKKTISILAFCADRAFGVCTNKHDDYRPKDKYSTNFWRANSSATGSVPHHV